MAEQATTGGGTPVAETGEQNIDDRLSGLEQTAADIEQAIRELREAGRQRRGALTIKEATAMLRDISGRMARFEDVDQSEIDALHDAMANVVYAASKAAGR